MIFFVFLISTQRKRSKCFLFSELDTTSFLTLNMNRRASFTKSFLFFLPTRKHYTIFFLLAKQIAPFVLHSSSLFPQFQSTFPTTPFFTENFLLFLISFSFFFLHFIPTISESIFFFFCVCFLYFCYFFLLHIIQRLFNFSFVVFLEILHRRIYFYELCYSSLRMKSTNK
jgi:hypothetical protein